MQTCWNWLHTWLARDLVDAFAGCGLRPPRHVRLHARFETKHTRRTRIHAHVRQSVQLAV